MSLETMTKLATTTVGVGGVASVTFSNIPQGYTDLKITTSARSTSGAAVAYSMLMKINNLTTSIYSQRALEGNGSAASSFSQSGVDTAVRATIITGTGATNSTFSNSEIYIPNYAGFTNKSVSIDTVAETNATTQYMNMISYLVSSPEPVTSLIFTAESAASSFAQHSTFTLYGIKNAAQTAGNSIKATGGNIIFDGTYVYHVFPSSGTFTPTQSILADYLVIAGGGGGGWGHGAGGGAGGLRSEINKQLISANYGVTIGAGGTTGTNYGASSKGTNGSDSIFNLVTSTGGGAGGGTANGVNSNGNSGGSGGGGSYSLGSGFGYAGAGNTPSTSPSQGNTGGQGSTGPASGGGGGGAGAVGATGAPGAGGVGSLSFSSWGVATGQGQNVSGTYYFAGGGGGGVENGTGAVGGLGGGGAGSGNNSSNGVAGTANTGGGGGGGGYSAYPGVGGGAGGSGIVIIRYKG